VGHSEASSGRVGLLRAKEVLGGAMASGNAHVGALDPLLGERLGSSSASVMLPSQAVASRLACGVGSFRFGGNIMHAVLAVGGLGGPQPLACGRVPDAPEELAPGTWGAEAAGSLLSSNFTAFGRRGTEAAGMAIDKVIAFGRRGADPAGWGASGDCSQTAAGRSGLATSVRIVYHHRAFPWLRNRTPSDFQPRNATALVAHLTQPGSIANLTIRPEQTPTLDLSVNEATINVKAAGLNFRDVLNVLGLDPTGTVRPMGGEAGGIVLSVGPACGHVLASEHVYGLVPGSLRIHAWCDARYIRCTRSQP
jgi:hypothetical protein